MHLLLVCLSTYEWTENADGLKQRITIAEVIENEWFKKGYKPPTFEQPAVSLDDVDAIFNESVVRLVFCIYITYRDIAILL